MRQQALLIVNVQRFAVRTGLLAAVHEEIFGTRVSMYIDEEVNVSALKRLPNHLFHTNYLRG